MAIDPDKLALLEAVARAGTVGRDQYLQEQQINGQAGAGDAQLAMLAAMPQTGIEGAPAAQSGVGAPMQSGVGAPVPTGPPSPLGPNPDTSHAQTLAGIRANLDQYRQGAASAPGAIAGQGAARQASAGAAYKSDVEARNRDAFASAAYDNRQTERVKASAAQDMDALLKGAVRNEKVRQVGQEIGDRNVFRQIGQIQRQAALDAQARAADQAKEGISGAINSVQGALGRIGLTTYRNAQQQANDQARQARDRLTKPPLTPDEAIARDPNIGSYDRGENGKGKPTNIDDYRKDRKTNDGDTGNPMQDAMDTYEEGRSKTDGIDAVDDQLRQMFIKRYGHDFPALRQMFRIMYGGVYNPSATIAAGALPGPSPYQPSRP